MKRRSLFGKLAAVAAAVAVAPAVAKAAETSSPACGDCAWLLGNPPQLPDGWRRHVPPPIDALLVQAAHEAAIRQDIGHHAAYVLLVSQTVKSAAGLLGARDNTAYIQGKLDQAAEMGGGEVIIAPRSGVSCRIGKPLTFEDSGLHVTGDAILTDGDWEIVPGSLVVPVFGPNYQVDAVLVKRPSA